ncbi:hypothetical protein POTOM_001184 [Populus tomentosa]|uniref:Uncharacterized protein n=1 Tax=Populus tomentosa TaxID=118781 RepID=A0A8X8DHF7_POPTO|nr:hypothetical protein POTOM_001184 [Populus tomentosa]
MAIIQRLYVSAKAFLSQLVPSDPAINLELHLPAESQPPVLSLTVNQETPQPPNSQPSSQATDLESQLPETLPPEPSLASINLQTPPPQQQHSFTTNHQPTNTESAVNQRFPWAKILIIAFCLSTAMQNDLTYEQIDQHTKPYLKLYLRAFCIALTFVSLILSQLIHDKFPLASRILEKVSISLGVLSVTMASSVVFNLGDDGTPPSGDHLAYKYQYKQMIRLMGQGIIKRDSCIHTVLFGQAKPMISLHHRIVCAARVLWAGRICGVKVNARSRGLEGYPCISWRYGLTAYLMLRKEGEDVVKEFV